MTCVFQHVQIDEYDRNVKQRAINHEQEHPPEEYSLYGGTCGDLVMKFPPQKGFVVNPQFRLAIVAPPGHPNPTIDMLGTPCVRTNAGLRIPDAVVTYIPFSANPPPHGYTNIPVLVEEVKPFLPKRVSRQQAIFLRADIKMRDYLTRINRREVLNSQAMLPYAVELRNRPCRGLLVFGTRCFRYNVTITLGQAGGDVNIVRLDNLNGPVLLYHERNTVLSRWMNDIRQHYIDRNTRTQPGVTDDQRMEWLRHELEHATRPIDYEAYLHGYAFTVLSLRFPFNNGFIAKPQSVLYHVAKWNQLGHARVNSYAEFVELDPNTLPDFIIAHFNGSYDTPYIIVEMKSSDNNTHRLQAQVQMHTNMTLIYKMCGLQIPGMAIMGMQCYHVSWTAGPQPNTANMYTQGANHTARLYTSRNPAHGFWGWYDQQWPGIRQQQNLP